MTIKLRKPKGRGGIGMHRNKDVPYKKLESGSKLKKTGDTKRAKEQQVFRLLRELIIQEVSNATGINKYVLGRREVDHVFGRNADGFAPLGAMLCPLNLQLITKEQHAEKTNATSRQDQRKDYRDTVEQEVMVNINRQILKRLPQPWNLRDVKIAIEFLIYAEE